MDKAIFLVLFSFVIGTSLGVTLFKQHHDNTTAAPGAPNVHYFGVPDPMHKLYSFIDDYGDLAGFSIDLVKGVCAEAKQDCYVIPVDPEDCLKTGRDITYGGKGMLGRWVDGCIHYEATTDIANVADFSLPLLTIDSGWAVARGNPAKMDPYKDDYTDLRIVHVSGFPQNNQCLRRLGKKFNTLLIAEDIEEAIKMVLKGEADALFTSQQWVKDLVTFDLRMTCGDGYETVIFPKGSADKAWWDRAFQSYYFSGKYDKLCDYYKDTYGRRPRCLPSPKDASTELLTRLRAGAAADAKSGPLTQFVVEGRSEYYSFLDKDGELQGFTKDLIHEVCHIAGRRCHLGLAEVSECMVAKGGNFYAGRGLLEAWFDGCTGYYDFNERRVSFDVTTAYLANSAAFNVAPGNPAGFDPSVENYSRWTIAYKALAETNTHCLNRLKKKFKKVHVVRDDRAGEEAVLSGKADTYFATLLSSDAVSGKLEQLKGTVHCDKVGTGILLRKGSKVKSWWDAAFDRFYVSGRYNSWCSERSAFYGFDFPCLERPKMARGSALPREEGF